jgi:hypothetical protein
LGAITGVIIEGDEPSDSDVKLPLNSEVMAAFASSEGLITETGSMIVTTGDTG